MIHWLWSVTTTQPVLYPCVTADQIRASRERRPNDLQPVQAVVAETLGNRLHTAPRMFAFFEIGVKKASVTAKKTG
jgi:hypothetical protein